VGIRGLHIMMIKLKVNSDSLSKMVKGEEFKAYFSQDGCSTFVNGSLTEIYVYPEDIKEVTKNYVVVKLKEH
jgi:hypothetical protein